MYILAQVAVVVHHWYDSCARFGRVAVVYTVYIRQYDERLSIHHRCHQPRQLVVVGKHKLCYAHGVVLVDDGQHAVFEHHVHACALVEILQSGREALLHGEYLPYVNAVFAEEVVVKVDELHLSYGRKELPLAYGIQLLS